MAQTLVQNYIHIVFSTKNRTPFIKPPYEMELHSYLGQVCINWECNVITIGGYLDHVHILCQLSKKITLTDLVKKLKTHSSKWLKNEGLFIIKFLLANWVCSIFCGKK